MPGRLAVPTSPTIRRSRKAANDLRDEDVGGSAGFYSSAQRKREFAIAMALHAHALPMAAEGDDLGV